MRAVAFPVVSPTAGCHLAMSSQPDSCYERRMMDLAEGRAWEPLLQVAVFGRGFKPTRRDGFFLENEHRRHYTNCDEDAWMLAGMSPSRLRVIETRLGFSAPPSQPCRSLSKRGRSISWDVGRATTILRTTTTTASTEAWKQGRWTFD